MCISPHVALNGIRTHEIFMWKMLSARKDVDHGDGAKTCDMSTEWPDDQANLDEFR